MKWEEPPGRGRSSGVPRKWVREAAELRANPKRWAILREGVEESVASAMQARMREGRVIAFAPAGTFEAKVRKMGDTWNVYARYVGEPDA